MQQFITLIRQLILGIKRRRVFTNWQSVTARQYLKWLKSHQTKVWFSKIPQKQRRYDVVFINAKNPSASCQKSINDQSYEGWQEKKLNKLTGDYIVFVESDCFLWSDFLVTVNNWLNKYPKTDLVYADNELTEPDGRRIPYFKPNYSFDLLLSVPYFGPVLVVSQKLLKKIKLRDRKDPVFLWDFCLKATEKTNQILHIPTILYGKFSPVPLPESGWLKPSKKVSEEQKSIIQEALKRRKLLATVEEGPFSGSYRIIYKASNKLVSIIISTKDRVDLLGKCVDGILNNNNYQNFELLIVNNNSRETETFEYFKKISHNPKVRIINYPKPFNIAAIYNFVVTKYSKGEYIVFMGNDTEPITKDWLARMVGYMQRKDVGAVGAKLLFPDQTIQHAGVVLGYGSAPDNSDRVAGHPYSRFPPHPGYFGTIELQRNYSAVTGAVILTRKRLYQKVGGFDGKNLRVLFNDVDYCLKLRHLGYSIVYAPEVILYHRESASLGKGHFINPQEVKYMRDKWHKWEDNDPFYNPNLTLDRPDYTLRV